MGRYSDASPAKLCGACADPRDADAWGEFVSRFHRPISLSVIRAAHQWGDFSHRLVEDLIQETYLKLCVDKCRLLHEFAIHHPESICGYIKTIAINVVHDHFKSLNAQKRGGGQHHSDSTDTDFPLVSCGLGDPEYIQRQVLLQEIEQCLSTCALGAQRDRDQTIFWLHYQQGLSARAIATLSAFNLSAKGVESILLRLTRLVREGLESQRSSVQRQK